MAAQSALPSTVHHNARMELFEGYIRRKHAPYPQLDSSSRGLSVAKSKSTRRGSGRTTRTRTPDSGPVATEKARDDDDGGAMARTRPTVERKRGSRPLDPCRGRTIYNAATTSPGPFGEILDARLPNGEVDPTLMELTKIIKEERLRVARWQAFVYGEGPEHWAHPDNITLLSMPRFTPITNSVLGPDEMPAWEPLVMDEAKLDMLFHQYFNVDEYMA